MRLVTMEDLEGALQFVKDQNKVFIVLVEAYLLLQSATLFVEMVSVWEMKHVMTVILENVIPLVQD